MRVQRASEREKDGERERERKAENTEKSGTTFMIPVPGGCIRLVRSM